MLDNLDDVLILTGPTGSGKSELALGLAQWCGAEIISMDSMALYRGLDIGTAKPTPSQRQLAQHHLIDVLDPWESASVAWWLEQARACCAEIRQRQRRILFVGGTPLYLKVLLRGLFEGPAADKALRQRLLAEAQSRGGARLHEKLMRVDPVTARRVHANDVRRIVRALEVLELTGRPISDWQRQWTKMRARVRAFWLDLPRPHLYDRINERVENMFSSGLVEEVRRLRQLPYPLSKEAGQALGYREVMVYLDGKASLADTIREIQTRSRNFAKRQITWFRHFPEVRAISKEASKELTERLWEPTIK